MLKNINKFVKKFGKNFKNLNNINFYYKKTSKTKKKIKL